MYETTTSITIEAAHFLRNYNGIADEPLHGHTWKIEVGVKSELLDPQGFVVDFEWLKKMLTIYVFKRFDHTVINNVPPFTTINPSAENIAKDIHCCIAKDLSSEHQLWVRVWENATCSGFYTQNSLETSIHKEYLP